MKERNNGYILNVASVASFAFGPLMASYYASKAYVLSLSMAINQELRSKKVKYQLVHYVQAQLKQDLVSDLVLN